MPNKNLMLVCFITTVLGVVALLLGFACHQWPLVLGDAVAYWPPVIHGAASGDYLCPPWQMAPVYDPQGLGRLTYHGFFLQWLLRHAGCKSYEDIYLAVGVFGVLAVVMTSASVFLLWKRHGGDAGLVSWAVLLVVPVAAAQQFLGVFSRPESLITLGTSLLAFLWMTQPWRCLHAVISGVIAGFCALTSPVAGVLMLTLGMALGVRLPAGERSKWCRWFVSSMAVIVLASFGLLYPYSLEDFIRGNLNHARIAVLSAGFADHLKYWLKESRCFGLAPLLIAVGSAMCHTLCGRRCWRTGEGILQAGLVGLFLVECWYFGVRQPERCYNLQACSPLLLGGGAAWLLSNSASQPFCYSRAVIFSLALLAGAGCYGGMVRYAISFRCALLYGEGFQSGALVVEECLAKTDGAVQVGKPLLPLSRSSRMHVLHDALPVTEYYVAAQSYSGLSDPIEVAGYELVENRFSKVVPQFLGIKIASSPNWYNLAVYRRLPRLPSSKP